MPLPVGFKAVVVRTSRLKVGLGVTADSVYVYVLSFYPKFDCDCDDNYLSFSGQKKKGRAPLFPRLPAGTRACPRFVYFSGFCYFARAIVCPIFSHSCAKYLVVFVRYEVKASKHQARPAQRPTSRTPAKTMPRRRPDGERTELVQ